MIASTFWEDRKLKWLGTMPKSSKHDCLHFLGRQEVKMIRHDAKIKKKKSWGSALNNLIISKLQSFGESLFQVAVNPTTEKK